MYEAIVFLPLAGFLIAGIFGRMIGARASETVTTAFLIVSALLSCIALYDVGWADGATKVRIFTFIDSGSFEADWTLRIDTLTAVMLVVVTSVSALVHLYSIGYMHDDPDRPRFFAYLSLFTFAMLMLVTSDNFIQMFFGWEGVGLASYLLIGFWFRKPSANAAAIKAFVVNRVGDFGYLLGIGAIFVIFGSVEFDTVFAAVPDKADAVLVFLGYEFHALTVACLLLFMGAMGKSAQFFLHTWLPDAMEGPTPVSALIHAATMVTAGVFLVCRLSPIYEYAPDALLVVTVIGATTAFFAATVGLFQDDIKRVIAYSTCSQLGYMFFAAGVSAYHVAMFHLFTHAFFKALLFLGAGAVIHGLHHEQDMRKMGGIYKLMPMTWMTMLIGTLALTGVGIPLLFGGFGFAGFYSKDAVIESAFAAHSGVGAYAFWMGVVAALLTSFYSWRLVFMTFHGKARMDAKTLSHVHDAPRVMMVPLVVLAVGAVFAGAWFYDPFIGKYADEFWQGSLVASKGFEAAYEARHHVPVWVLFAPLTVTILGFAIAWIYYIRHPDVPARLAANQGPIYTFVKNKWYFDELYDVLFVKPAFWIGRLFWKGGDGRIIDGMGPDGVAARVVDVTNQVVRLQSGYLYHYAFAMLIGVAALVTYYMVVGF